MNNSVNWSIVKMIDIFEIYGGYYNKKPPMSEKVIKNSLPFLGASDKNNGITGFVKKEDIYTWDKTGKRTDKDIDKRIFKGNAIAVTNNGSVGNAYYMENDFTCSHDINVLYLKNHTLNKNIAMFLISCIERSAEGFSYSVKWRPKRMVKSNMTLPMRGNVPDWDYMENYIENKKQKQKQDAKIFLEKLLSQVSDYEKVDRNNIRWGTFVLGEICNIKNSVRLTKSDMISGNRPFIGASDSNNGITNFVSNTNKSLDSNVLGVNYNGSVCEGFYHPYNALFSDDVKRLTFKKGINNEFTLQYLNTSISKQKDKYTYGYKFNATRMKKQRIVLPIKDNDSIDFNFMENLVKEIKYFQIKKAINILD